MIEAKEVLDKMHKNQKINYDRVLQKMVQEWEKEAFRPKILLHSCCAPCSTYTLEYLTKYADVDIYFANSNIHPATEYERRRLVQEKFVQDFNRDYGTNIQLISAPYEPQKFVQMIQEAKLEEAPEGGDRCHLCFDMRLSSVADKAAKLGYDYFASALTVSPHKNSQVINEVGLDVEEEHAVSYLPSDFKKNNGYRRTVEMCKIYDIYRQCYCGCVFAARQQELDLKAISKEAKEAIPKLREQIEWNIQQNQK